MGQYRVQDLLLWPSLISLTRVPLALLFFFVVSEPGLALAVLALAAASDIVDGWLARRYGWVTALGAVVDGITDKLFVAGVVIALIVQHRLSVPQALLLATREIGEVPLVLLWTFHRQRRRARSESPAANMAGKAATVVQFVAVMAALMGSVWTGELVYAASLIGAGAALTYWRREFSRS